MTHPPLPESLLAAARGEAPRPDHAVLKHALTLFMCALERTPADVRAEAAAGSVLAMAQIVLQSTVPGENRAAMAEVLREGLNTVLADFGDAGAEVSDHA